MASGRVSKVKGKVIDIPNAPTIGTATAGAESATVAFTAYSGSVGGPTFSYRAVSNPDSVVGTGTTSPVTVSGLTAGTAYTFTVAGVNPTGTGAYSSASNSITPIAAGDFESIQTVTVGSSGASSITFSSIPSTYKSLQLRIFGKTVRTTYSISELKMTFNGDTGNNYAGHYLTGNGADTVVYASGFTGNPRFQIIGFGTSLNSQYGSAVIDVIDYASSSKYKTTKILNGGMGNVAGAGSYYGQVGLLSGLWMSTSAITSISLTPEDPVNFTQYSSFALYGLKG